MQLNNSNRKCNKTKVSWKGFLKITNNGLIEIYITGKLIKLKSVSLRDHRSCQHRAKNTGKLTG